MSNMAVYELKDKKLKIFDEDLQIDIDEKFDLKAFNTPFDYQSIRQSTSKRPSIKEGAAQGSSIEESPIEKSTNSLLSVDNLKIDDEKGLFIERYENGKVKKASFIKGSFFHGQTLFFDEKGELLSLCFYYEDLLHGPSIFFAKKKIISLSWFCFGKREGKTKRYYLGGKLYAEESYKDGLLHQEQKYYYKDKTVKSFLIYEHGKLKKASLYYENGLIKREIDRKLNLDKIYNEKGDLLK